MGMTPRGFRSVFIDSQARGRPSGQRRADRSHANDIARMAAAGLPVPHAFIVTGNARAEEGHETELQAELNQVLTTQLRRLESATRLIYGSSRRPLLLSVGCGVCDAHAAATRRISNVELNETTVRGLLRTTGNPRVVWDAYCRLVRSFAEVVDLCECAPFDTVFEEALNRGAATRAQELDGRALAQLAREYLALYRKLVGRNFPQDAVEQLRAAVNALLRNRGMSRSARRSNARDAEYEGTVIVQRVVFGTGGGPSGSGVAFTRNPDNGDNRVCVEFMFSAQAEDVRAARDVVFDVAQLSSLVPALERQLNEAACTLEVEFKDMQVFDFTVQDELLYLLQTRDARPTAIAALRVAADQVRENLLEPSEALERVCGIDVARLRQESAARSSPAPILAKAMAIGSGVAVGAIVLDREKAALMSQREPVILVQHEPGHDAAALFEHARAVLCARGGRTSRLAEIARALGRIALVGCAELVVDARARTCRIGNATLSEGDVICLYTGTGNVLQGCPDIVGEAPAEMLAEIERWRRQPLRAAAKVRGRAV